MMQNNAPNRRTISALPLITAGIFCLLAVGRAGAMSQPLTQHVEIINRCEHAVEARAKQRLTRPWKKVARRFTLEAGERLEDSRQLAGLFGFGVRQAPPPKVSFSHQGREISSAVIKRFMYADEHFIIIACSENMTDEEKMSPQEWYRWRNEQRKREIGG
jgi:hypothetical protein